MNPFCSLKMLVINPSHVTLAYLTGKYEGLEGDLRRNLEELIAKLVILVKQNSHDLPFQEKVPSFQKLMEDCLNLCSSSAWWEWKTLEQVMTAYLGE